MYASMSKAILEKYTNDLANEWSPPFLQLLGQERGSQHSGMIPRNGEGHLWSIWY